MRRRPEAVSYTSKSATQAEQFAAALRAAGMPAAAVSVQPTVIFADHQHIGR